MSSRQLRIGISGPAGAGKTTLVRALASQLSLPIIDEDLVALYNAQGAFQQVVKDTAAPAAVQRRALVDWMRTYFDWCDARDSAYAQHESFVADRWELDLFGYWLHAFVQYDTNEDTRRLHDIFLRRSREFNLLVMLPVGDFAVDAHNEVGLKRQTSRNRSLLTQTSFTGLLAQVPASIARYVPLEVKPVEDRVADIMKIAANLQRD